MCVEDNNILWLDMFQFLTYQKRVKLLNMFDKGADIRTLIFSNPKTKDVLTEQEINKMQTMSNKQFEEYLSKLKKENIETITLNDNRYPTLLKETSMPPLCLYCKGNIQLLNSLCVAIVGTRKVSAYGSVVTKKYAKALANAGITIVSGLAVGVDTVAHRTALEENGATIAVLAGGIHHIYPQTNFSLAQKIAQTGLLISENNPDAPPLSYHFPIRNRIIAGLSRAVLITEAGLKSGALHTKNYCLDFNRELFAVPGQINSLQSEGTNLIIKECQASLTTSPDDIISALGLKTEKNEKTLLNQLDIEQQLVLDYIKTAQKTFQEIADYTKLPASKLNGILLQLEMDGLVQRFANNSYIMC